MAVELKHLNAQIDLLREDKDPGFSMAYWFRDWNYLRSSTNTITRQALGDVLGPKNPCGTTHCLYGGAALLSGEDPEEVQKGCPSDWDVGENTGCYRRLFSMQQLSAKHVITLFDAIRGGTFNLAGADLSGVELSFCDLSDADLRSANLSRAFGNYPVFTGALLDDANFEHARMTGRFDNTKVNRTNFSNTWMYESTFDGAIGSHACFDGAMLNSSRFEGAILQGSNFTEADLGYVHFENADITGSVMSKAMVQGMVIHHDQLPGIVFGENKGDIKISLDPFRTKQRRPE